MWLNNILETMGDTPLIKINNVASHVKPTVLGKVEYFNPGNSIKDRIGVKMIQDAERKGLLKPGGTIIEGTSGNTGMGLALVAAIKGYRCIFTMPDKQSKEKMDILRAMGAEVVVTPTAVEPDDPRSYYSVAKRLSKEIPNSYYPNQYDNLSNQEAHYESTGPEIWAQTEGKITHLVAGMGTCGTMSGIARYLKEQNPNIVCVGVDTYGSVFKKYHETGEFDRNEIYSYLTEGIGEDILPANLNMSLVDQIIKVTDKDAAIMARKLARLEGLFVGWSCGSAMHGALEYARGLSKDDVVVVILPDHGTRYLGKIYNDQWMSDHHFIDKGNMLTAQEILDRKGKVDTLFSVSTKSTLSEVILLMREHSITQLPVVEGGNVVGTINESRVLNTILDDPSLKDSPVADCMSDPFPFVLPTTRIDLISKMINKDCPAVMMQDANGGLHIITKSDLIAVLAG
ncbi:MAG: cystathionine beta-synthase [Bacteroidetes bacterium]|jgi:cystathionine beta-synthase|nr:cystathionine beta-synthase [Bacteroidota bacterium]MBL0015811.1 cystathionine beta-synthase [Bacteroidota bacterium]MBP6638791.1 cystathionine beta-synthase [Bacteroidia bacterium]